MSGVEWWDEKRAGKIPKKKIHYFRWTLTNFEKEEEEGEKWRVREWEKAIVECVPLKIEYDLFELSQNIWMTDEGYTSFKIHVFQPVFLISVERIHQEEKSKNRMKKKKKRKQTKRTDRTNYKPHKSHLMTFPLLMALHASFMAIAAVLIEKRKRDCESHPVFCVYVMKNVHNFLR